MIDLAHELLLLSQKMLSLAESKEWQVLEDTQNQRLQIIRKLEMEDASSLSKPESEEVANLLKQCRDLERQCEELATYQRTSLTSVHTKMSKGKAMKRAYGAYGR